MIPQKIQRNKTEKFEGVIPSLQKQYDRTDSFFIKEKINTYVSEKTCNSCGGQRLNEVARNVLQTKVSALIADTETDYSTNIKLILSENRLRERGCSIAEVEAALSSNKKFKMEVTGELITLNLVEEVDTATAIAIRNKVLNTTVKGVPDIERVTLVQKDDEWVIFEDDRFNVNGKEAINARQR